MFPSLLVLAVNTAADSENRIHDDGVAAAYGFAAALVPGVTIYGYMASAAIGHFGPQWLQSGAMDVRFFQPFYAGEQVAVSCSPDPQPREAGDKIKIEAGTRASAIAWLLDTPIPSDDPPHQPMPVRVPASRETIRPGLVLGTLTKTLDLSEPALSAPFDAFLGDQRLAHPAIILGLANEILMSNFILGPWIHSASEVRNASPARDGEPLEVRAKIVDAYERKRHEFAVLDVVILSAARLVARIRHTAIWQPRPV